MSTNKRLRVLILCTGNSCRSQMTEGWIRHLFGGRIEAHSAGSKPSGYVHPLAVRAMAEVGIDIGEGESKHVNLFLGQTFDYVLTVCDLAKEACPVFPGTSERAHRSFDDPADAAGSQAEKLEVFRRVRDEIREWIEELFPTLEGSCKSVKPD